MLQISNGQMAELRALRHAAFALWLRDYVRRNDPSIVAAWSDDALVEGLQIAIRRATRYGITEPVSVAEYFSAMVLHGPMFDELPLVHALLTNPAVPPNARIHDVFRRASAEKWTTADRTSAAWWPDAVQGAE
jgi:hypothetical protein